jgi:hypothetical protein
MNTIFQIFSVIITLGFGYWLMLSTNSLQQGIVGAIVLLNCTMLIDLSYRFNKVK